MDAVGLRRSGLSDGLGVARGLAARNPASPTSTTCLPALMLDLPQRGARWPRSTAAPTVRRYRCSIRRSFRVSSGDVSVGYPDALCVRLDRNGFLAAVRGGRTDPKPSRPTRSCGCAPCRLGCASTHGSVRCTAVAATPRWSCARPVSVSRRKVTVMRGARSLRRQIGRRPHAQLIWMTWSFG